ncbi:hypothetical protein OG897_13225 [Streptomyces sp. NBC_00237]|nr:hypothetical protein [Streptomyces sp. NBC_00237]MCX5202404.1 hypothetical protein [Streptomyces sp. NBC_00237]
MPHDIQAWANQQDDRVTVYINEALVSEVEARKLEAAYNEKSSQ